MSRIADELFLREEEDLERAAQSRRGQSEKDFEDDSFIVHTQDYESTKRDSSRDEEEDGMWGANEDAQPLRPSTSSNAATHDSVVVGGVLQPSSASSKIEPEFKTITSAASERRAMVAEVRAQGVCVNLLKRMGFVLAVSIALLIGYFLVADVNVSVLPTHSPSVSPTSKRSKQATPSVRPSRTRRPTRRPRVPRFVAPSESPPTPTPTPDPAQPSPTSAPWIADDEVPVLGLDQDDSPPVEHAADPRYGPPALVLSPKRWAFWNSSLAERNEFAVFMNDLTQSKSKPPNTLRAEFCALQNAARPQTKYVFPRRGDAKMKDGLAFRSDEEMLRRARQYRAALSEYYESPLTVTSAYKPERGRPERAVLLARWTHVLRRAKARGRLVVGTMGSSVMSGQDNCYTATYAPLLERELNHLFDASGVRAEVRNLGQNGDGPEFSSQILAAPELMGAPDLDLLVLWYPMIPPPSALEMDLFLRRFVDRGAMIWAIHFPYVPLDLVSKGHVALHVDFWKLPPFESAYQWIEKDFEGWKGDGRCHNATREGEVAIVRENWHMGPMFFQLLVDATISFVAQGAELYYEKGLVELPAFTLGLSRPGFPDAEVRKECESLATGNAASQLQRALCDENAYESLRLVSATGIKSWWSNDTGIGTTWSRVAIAEELTTRTDGWWQYHRYKKASSIHNNIEHKQSRAYADRLEECNSHLDVGTVFRFNTSSFDFAGGSSSYLRLYVPDVQTVRSLNESKAVDVLVCTSWRGLGWLLESLAGWRVEFRLNDRVERSRMEDLMRLLKTCVLVARDLPAVRPGDEIALRLEAPPRPYRNESFAVPERYLAVGSVFLVGRVETAALPTTLVPTTTSSSSSPSSAPQEVMTLAPATASPTPSPYFPTTVPAPDLPSTGPTTAPSKATENPTSLAESEPTIVPTLSRRS